MIDIFKQYAPVWETEVARFARKFWYNQVDEETIRIYKNKAR
jgi:hypothetical protein